MNMQNTAAPSITTVWGARIEQHKETWDRYTIGKQLAKGGMGSVHELYPEYKPQLVAKLFGETMIARIKGDPKIAMRLVALVKHRADIAEILPFATWPRRVLFSKERPRDTAEISNTIVGFTMPRLDRTFSLFELLMAEDRRLRMTPQHSAHIAITIADQLAHMHRHPWGFVFGDLSPNNIHISPDFSKIHFIDTDSFQFEFQSAKYTFTQQGITDGYRSPGIDAQLKATGRATANHDDFVLAILLFQIFMMDRQVPRHPFQSMATPLDLLIAKRAFPYDDPQTYPVPATCLDAYRSFPAEIRQAFTRTFTTPATVTADEWTRILHNYRRLLRPR